MGWLDGYQVNGAFDTLVARVEVLRLLRFMTLLFGSAFALAAHSEEPLRIVLVGVEDAGAVSLRGPVEDVCALYRTYVHVLNVPARNVSVFMSPPQFPPDSPCQNVEVILSSRQNIDRLLPDIGANGTILFHYSGHGTQRGEEPELILGDRKNLAGRVALVSLSDLHAALTRRPGSRRIVYFLDACREVIPSADGSATPAARLEQGIDAGAVFFAATAGSYSYIRPNGVKDTAHSPIGYFTWSLIKALVGGAGKGQGRVTLRELAAHLQTDVPRTQADEFIADGFTQIPSAQFIGKGAEIELPARRRGTRFMLFVEAQATPLDGQGRLLSAPSSMDAVLPSAPDERAELLALSPIVVNFPGPFVFHLPTDGLPEAPARWQYRVRLTFMLGMNRRQFIVCDAAPDIVDEVQTRIVGPTLVIDPKEALRRIGHSLFDDTDSIDLEAPPTEFRHLNARCKRS